MLIQTKATPDPARLEFLPDRQVLASGTMTFGNKSEAEASPLVEQLFAISGVASVTLSKDYIAITRDAGDWQQLKPEILGVIMDHFLSEAPILRNRATESAGASGHAASGDSAAVERIRTALRQVIDPELGYNIVDLGLVYDVTMGEGGEVAVTMTTTTPGCPATNYLKAGAGEAAGAVDGVEFVDVELSYEPRWTPEMMTAEAKAHFGIRDGGGW